MRSRLHLRKLQRGLLSALRLEQRGLRLILLPTAKKPPRRFRNKQTAQHKHNAGRQRNPEDAAPRVIFEAEERRGVAQLRHRIHAIAEVHAHKRRRHNAQRQHPLEDRGAFAATRRSEALGQVKRNHNTDQSAACALQQPSEQQRPVALRQRNHRNAHDECASTYDHERLAAHPVSQQTGE